VSLLVTDPGTERRLLILGDALHTRAQYAEPDWVFRSDVDPARARASRAELLAEHRDGRTTFAGGHFAGSAFDVTEGTARSY
jgi:glyoxylase-like metal-dependent hydrolase (beta-lactamase superfamily II)